MVTIVVGATVVVGAIVVKTISARVVCVPCST